MCAGASKNDTIIHKITEAKIYTIPSMYKKSSYIDHRHTPSPPPSQHPPRPRGTGINPKTALPSTEDMWRNPMSKQHVPCAENNVPLKGKKLLPKYKFVPLKVTHIQLEGKAILTELSLQKRVLISR